MSASRTPWWWLRPDFATLFLFLHIGATVCRSGDLLKDPGTGWHLATGRLILATGAVPREDPFSYTALGHPWVNYYWLFEVVSATLERWGGLPLFATVWVLVYGLVPVVLYRTMLHRRASPLPAFLVVLVAYTVLLSHALTRPHVVTYLLFAILLDRLDGLRREPADTRALYWLPLVSVLWANTHGGFLSGLWAVGVTAGATAVRWLVLREERDRRPAAVLGGLLVLMTVATLANPYGWHLHVQGLEHLRLPSTGYFNEFRSPDFRDGGAAVGCFEVMVLGVITVLALRLVRVSWAELALLLGTLHAALTSARNMNLFVLVAAPIVALGLTEVFARGAPALYARWQAIAAEQEERGAWRVQVPALCAVTLALAIAGRLPLPTTLDGQRLSAGAATFIDAHADRFQRAFNTDGLGGALIYRFWPRLHVFVDDRTIVYGEEFVMHDYFTVLYGRPGWQAVLDRWGVTSAIVATSTGCAEMLQRSGRWVVDYADDENVLLSRLSPAAETADDRRL